MRVNDNDFQVVDLTGFLARGHGSATSNSDLKNMAVYDNILWGIQIFLHIQAVHPQNL